MIDDETVLLLFINGDGETWPVWDQPMKKWNNSTSEELIQWSFNLVLPPYDKHAQVDQPSSQILGGKNVKPPIGLVGYCSL